MPCPAGGAHDNRFESDYSLNYDSGAQPNRQQNWRWCNKCSVLAFSGYPPNNNFGVCAAGGKHDFGGSGQYVVMVDEPHIGQQLWKWCKKCSGLNYDDGTRGRCQAGGKHDNSGSGNYSVSINGNPGGDQNQWRWCSKCRLLSFDDGSSTNMGLKIWVPPPDVRVRIIGASSKTALYLHPRNDHKLSNHTMSEVYPDQWFFIVPESGLHRIKSEFTNEGIYFNRDTAGSIDWNSFYPDQLFRFEPGSGKNAGTFRIICPETSTVLYSPNEDNRDVSICDVDAVYDDQYFTFATEDINVGSSKSKGTAQVAASTRKVSRTSQVRSHMTRNKAGMVGAGIVGAGVVGGTTVVTEDVEKDPPSDPESAPQEDPESDPESDPQEDPESDPESDPQEDPESDPESDPQEDQPSDPESDPQEDPPSDPESDPQEDPDGDGGGDD